MGRILIIEDDPDVAELIATHVSQLGFTSQHFGTAGDCLSAVSAANDYILVILDLNLPDMDGMEVCKRLRQGGHQLPILMLTSRSEELDRVLGLELGADDYMTKPFSVRELRARVSALVRRSKLAYETHDVQAGTPTLKLGDLTIDLEARQVRVKDKEANLSALQFDFLVFLASAPGRTYTKQQLFEHLWGYISNDGEHAVVSLIKRIREEIEDDSAAPRYILTVRGVGYRFANRDELGNR